MKLRTLLLLLPLLATSGRVATASEPLEALEVSAEPTGLISDLLAEVEVVPPVVPSDPPVDAELAEIRWTVLESATIDEVASRWGMTSSHLLALNPALSPEVSLEPGMKLRVFQRDEGAPTRSIGAPNRGRLQHGMPMPEGSHWVLRDRRVRAFGAANTVKALVTAFNEYGRSFEDAPPVSVGELSGRRGGRAFPHRSHRTGRDVDLGYIIKPGVPMTSRFWTRADADNFDVEKNWALIKALVATGEVQQIFISSRLQRLLKPIARAELSDQEYGRYFWVTGQDADRAPLLRHWDGHRDHMHVRFRCGDQDGRCRSRSVSNRRHKHNA